MSNEQREQQIIEAAEKATYQKPPQYSELTLKTHKVMCAYEVGFIDGCVWADSHPQWIPVEERLPEVGESVWFYTPIMDEPMKGAYQGNDTWWSVEYESKFIDCVTHWMPLPTPPARKEV